MTGTRHVGLKRGSLGHPNGKAQNMSYSGMMLGGGYNSIQVAPGLTLAVCMEAV